MLQRRGSLRSESTRAERVRNDDVMLDIMGVLGRIAAAAGLDFDDPRDG